MHRNSTPSTICLIDDDRIYQFTAKRIIQLVDPSQKVLAFSNGKEALEYFQTRCGEKDALPDIIFLDINMPVMDGWEFLEGFSTVEPVIEKKITIYMVSSSVDEKDMTRCKSFDYVEDYIVKPLHQQMMKSLISSIQGVA